MKIAITDTTYEKLFNVVLLAQYNKVVSFNSIPKTTPIQNKEKLDFKTTFNKKSVPILNKKYFYNSKILKNLGECKKLSDIIIVNYIKNTIQNMQEKIDTHNILRVITR